MHLESLNRDILLNNLEWFPNINQWRKEFWDCTKYYSTATSTYMVITDLMCGDVRQFEEASNLENIFRIKPQKIVLMDRLNEAGYNTYDFWYGYNNEDIQDAERLHKIINAKGRMWIGDDSDCFEKELYSILNSTDQFAIFVADNASHISYTGNRIDRSQSLEIRQKRRYEEIDRTFGTIMQGLKNLDLINDTVVIAYGDHGEEFWTHGLHEGYTHAIEPFHNMIHCPLYIKGVCEWEENDMLDSIISTEDIYQITLRMLGIEQCCNSAKRKYAFARNLYGNQVNRAFVFGKAYAVTNGEYLLMVSNRGLSLYNNCLDPDNHCNLLNFYTLNEHGIVYNIEYENLISTHIKSVFDEEINNNISCVFNDMRGSLQNFIKYLDNVRGRICFNKINYDRQFFREKIKCKFKINYYRIALQEIIRK